MIQKPKDVKTNFETRDGTIATLQGRLAFKEPDSGDFIFLNIYSVPEDKAVKTYEKNIEIFTPMSSNAYRLTLDNLLKWSKRENGGLVISKQYWDDYFSKAEEDIDVYDSANGMFTSLDAARAKEYVKILHAKNMQKEIENIQEKTTSDKKEKKTMNTFNNGTVNMLGDAVKQGAKLAAANQANQMLSDLALSAIQKAGVPEEFLEDDTVKNIFKVAVPILLHFLAESQGQTIDNWVTEGAADRIKEVCGLATTVNTQEVIAPMLSMLIPALKEMATTISTQGYEKIMGGLEGADLLAGAQQKEKSVVDEVINQKQKVKATA